MFISSLTPPGSMCSPAVLHSFYSNRYQMGLGVNSEQSGVCICRVWDSWHFHWFISLKNVSGGQGLFCGEVLCSPCICVASLPQSKDMHLGDRELAALKWCWVWIWVWMVVCVCICYLTCLPEGSWDPPPTMTTSRERAFGAREWLRLLRWTLWD